MSGPLATPQVGRLCEGCQAGPASELVLAVTAITAAGGQTEQRMDAQLVGLCGGCLDAAAELGLVELGAGAQTPVPAPMQEVAR